MVSSFPATLNMDIKMSELHHAMPSALEKTTIDERVAFSKLPLGSDVRLIFGVLDERCKRFHLEKDVWFY